LDVSALTGPAQRRRPRAQNQLEAVLAAVAAAAGEEACLEALYGAVEFIIPV